MTIYIFLMPICTLYNTHLLLKTFSISQYQMILVMPVNFYLGPGGKVGFMPVFRNGRVSRQL